jgi:CspA family cold shock protein
MHTGTVRFYNRCRGFGFIQPDRNEADVYIHSTALERAGISDLIGGQRVKFETGGDPSVGKTAVRTIELAS